MYRLMLASLAAVSVLAIAPAANAVILVYGGTFSGANENPVNASPGTGTALVIINTTTHQMNVQATYSGLTTGVSAAHIHCCQVPPTNAMVATVTPSFTGFPATTSGAYNFTYDLTAAVGTWNPAFVTASGGTVALAEAAFLAGLANGQAYFNIHTANFPGGEIRANLTAVPEPATWAMLITGFGALGLMMRRRRALQPA